MTDLPPLPDWKPRTVLLSPKQSETQQSLGTRMVRVAPQIAPSGFVLTNISVLNGSVTLQWQSGTPLFQIQSSDLTGGWSNVLGATTARIRTFPESARHYFRVQGDVMMPLTLDQTGQPRLTWQAPDIDMSDSLQAFTLQRRGDPPPADQAIADNTGWTDIATPASTDRQASDATAIPSTGLWYRLRETTANGVVVPYGVQSISNNQSGQILLQRMFGPTNSAGGFGPTRIIVDHAGDVIICGNLQGTVDFGNGIPLTSYGGQDLAIAKYSAAGVCKWSRHYGQVSSDGAGDVAVNSLNQIFLFGSISTGPTPGVQDFHTGGPLTCYGDSDVILIKLDTDGNVIGTPKVAGSSGGDIGVSIAIDSSDNVYLGGTHGNFASVGFDLAQFGGPVLASHGQNKSLFIVKLNSALSHQWSRNFGAVGGSGSDNVILEAIGGKMLAVDSALNVYFIAQFIGDCNFGFGTVSAGAQSDAVLVKLSGVDGSNTSFHRQLRNSGTGKTVYKSLAVDSANNALVTGTFATATTINPGGGVIDGNTDGGTGNGGAFLASYTAAGVFNWQWFCNRWNNGGVIHLAIDSQRRPIAALFFDAAADTGFGYLLDQAQDFVIQRFSTTGVPQFALRGQPFNDQVNSLAVGIGDTIYGLGLCNANSPLSGSQLQSATGTVIDNAQQIITTPGTLNNLFWIKLQP